MNSFAKLCIVTGLALALGNSPDVSQAGILGRRPARVQAEDGIMTLQSRRSLVEIDRNALPPGSPPGAIRVWPPQIRVYRIAR